MNYRLTDSNIEALLYRWGRWLNHDFAVQGELRRRSATYTPRQEQPRQYWQSCQRCWGSGADLSAAGSGVRNRAALLALGREKPCPACRGRKGRWMEAIPADPTTIRPTGLGGTYVPIRDKPAEFVGIEEALKGLGLRREAVIYSRYVHFPRYRAVRGVTPDARTGGEMVRLQWVNERITPDKIAGSTYRNLLTDSKRRLASLFGLPLARNPGSSQGERLSA